MFLTFLLCRKTRQGRSKMNKPNRLFLVAYVNSSNYTFKKVKAFLYIVKKMGCPPAKKKINKRGWWGRCVCYLQLMSVPLRERGKDIHFPGCPCLLFFLVESSRKWGQRIFLKEDSGRVGHGAQACPETSVLEQLNSRIWEEPKSHRIKLVPLSISAVFVLGLPWLPATSRLCPTGTGGYPN